MCMASSNTLNLCCEQIRCSNQLKEEGNRLFGAQRTEEAMVKYKRAKDNLKGTANRLVASCWLHDRP